MMTCTGVGENYVWEGSAEKTKGKRKGKCRWQMTNVKSWREVETKKTRKKKAWEGVKWR